MAVDKKFAIITFFLIIISSFPVQPVLAQQQAIEIQNPLTRGSIPELIDAIVGFLFWLGMVLVPLFILVGAFYILTSGGSQNRLAKGKKIIFYAIIGLLLILLARGIIGMINVILGLS